jgi:MFS family permease
MGYNNSINSVGAASYPVIGGALATIGWFYPFLLSLLAIPVGILAIVSLQSPAIVTDTSLKDYIRAIIRELRNREVVGLLLATGVMFIVLYGGFLAYFPFLIETKFAVSPLLIGIIISSRPFIQALGATQMGPLSKHITRKQMLQVGFVVGACVLFVVPLSIIIWMLFIPSIGYGLVMGFTIPTIQTRLAEIVPIDCRAEMMALFGTAVRIGQTIGPLAMGLVFIVWGLDAIYIFAGIFLGIGGILVSIFLQSSSPINIDS